MPADTVAVAADHGGYELKKLLSRDLEARGFKVCDLGTDNCDSVDYPDFAKRLVKTLAEGKARFGVLLCGSGIGMSIAANRYPGIRAALVHDSLSARLARQHNDANVLVMGGRMIGPEVARECLAAFLDAEFEGGRHARRVAKLSEPIT